MRLNLWFMTEKKQKYTLIDGRIRKATDKDLSRIAEIIIFNYRLNFYPIFCNDEFYFQELQVTNLIEEYKNVIDSMWVYDDGIVKAVMQVENEQLKKLFVEPVLQGQGIGASLLDYAVRECKVRYLWVLEKNARAIVFYERHGFCRTLDKKLEEDTEEYLIRVER